jgi:hypothetical protein
VTATGNAPDLENPHAGQGAVVLDIGGDVGALVVAAPAELAGAEIEICPAGVRGQRPDEGAGWWTGQWRHVHHHGAGGHVHHAAAWPHVGVVARPTPSGPQHSAVFPGLRAGRYELWVRPDHPTALAVDVRGGEVAVVDWPRQGA